jgi:hypothetical protein
MTPLQMVYASVTTLTGGLINDMTTACLGVVAIGVIICALDYLKDMFDGMIQRAVSGRALEKARSYKKMENSMDDEVSKDFLRAKYRNEIRKAAK